MLTASALLGALAVSPASARVPLCRTWHVTSTRAFPVGTFFQDASATSSSDAWAVGIDGNGNVIGHWDGQTWTSVDSNEPNTNLYDVTAVSTTDAWAVGAHPDPHGGFENARILHWDGTAWSVYPAPKGGSYGAFLYSVSADSATDVWAVGAWSDNQGVPHPLALHFDGTKWTRVATVSPSLADVFNAVYAISPDDVWAVGYEQPVGVTFQPLIEHWDGSAWSVVPAPTIQGDSNFLYDVSGTASNDVWAVGPMGSVSLPTALHWDGSVWSVITLEGRPGKLYTFLDVVAVAPNDVWVAGISTREDLTDQGAAAEHWDGSTWTITRLLTPGTSGGFYGIGASSSTDVWAVGFLYDSSFVPHPLAELAAGPCSA